MCCLLGRSYPSAVIINICLFKIAPGHFISLLRERVDCAWAFSELRKRIARKEAKRATETAGPPSDTDKDIAQFVIIKIVLDVLQ